MIHIQEKRYQLMLWEFDRDGASVPLRLDFDSIDQARAEFEAHRQAGRYRTGIMIEWHRISGVSNLLDQYPKE